MKKVEILIVEDSLTQALRLKFVLEQEGFQTHHAIDALKALELLKSIKPTLIISDVMMPNMDGYTFCATVKADPELREIPVILVTSLSDPTDVILALKAGADNFLTKPYDERALISRIRHILANLEIRGQHGVEMGVEVFFAGKRYFLNSSRIQMIDLLLSTYESAVQKNQELHTTNLQLREALENISILQKNYLQLLETNADSIFVIDAEKMVRYANPAANTLFADDGSNMTDQRFPINLEDRERGEVEIVDRAGTPVFLDFRTMKTDWDGKIMDLIILRDVTPEVSLRRELQQLSLTDDLTKLYNRRGFMLFASRAVLQSKRQRQRLFIIFADLDNLKRLNDSQGHQTGDFYLASAASLLASSFREVDTAARMGGDEFAVLGLINEDCIPESLVERFFANIKKFNTENASLPEPLEVSIGLAIYDPAVPEPIEAAIDRADDEMYKNKKAKKAGRS
jgi:two-component system cell cycle response regulator